MDKLMTNEEFWQAEKEKLTKLEEAPDVTFLPWVTSRNPCAEIFIQYHCEPMKFIRLNLAITVAPPVLSTETAEAFWADQKQQLSALEPKCKHNSSLYQQCRECGRPWLLKKPT